MANFVTTSNVKMFCVYHKCYYVRKDTEGFTFFGVNEIYPKEKKDNTILEYELDIYNPFLQKRGYMETSAYLHVYWNKLYLNSDMIGFSQYDMKHTQSYDNLDKNSIYFMHANTNIIQDKNWNYMMFPRLRNLDFIIKSYNNHFNKTYSIKELEKKPLSLWQTNIYPVSIYEKLCGWLEKLVEEIYPWSNQPPYEQHFGSIGGYTERALSIFNAFELHEGVSFHKLKIHHHIGSVEREQYDRRSFLNNYSQDIHCKLVDNVDLDEYTIIDTTIKNNSVIRESSNEVTRFYYIDSDGNKSKELMVLGNSKDDKYQWHHNILQSDLSNYTLYYKNDKNYVYIYVSQA